MLSEAHRRALLEIARRLEGKGVIWALTGSTGMALQGVPLEVKDIDMQTDREGAFAIGQEFAAEMFRPVAFSGNERIRSYFGRFVLEGIQVEIMGEIEKRLPDGSWEAPPDLRKVRKWIKWEGTDFPVLDLMYECRAYRLMGRTERADFLQKWLEKH
jgi:hypothetical protein